MQRWIEMAGKLIHAVGTAKTRAMGNNFGMFGKVK